MDNKVKTRQEEERKHLKWCQKKLKESPEAYKRFWEEEIRKSKKFIYGD